MKEVTEKYNLPRLLIKEWIEEPSLIFILICVRILSANTKPLPLDANIKVNTNIKIMIFSILNHLPKY